MDALQAFDQDGGMELRRQELRVARDLLEVASTGYSERPCGMRGRSPRLDFSHSTRQLKRPGFNKASAIARQWFNANVERRRKVQHENRVLEIARRSVTISRRTKPLFLCDAASTQHFRVQPCTLGGISDAARAEGIVAERHRLQRVSGNAVNSILTTRSQSEDAKRTSGSRYVSTEAR